MQLSSAASLNSERLRNALDWTVFSLGVLSLTTAIGATVLTHMDVLQAETASANDEITVTTLADVL